MTRNRSHKTRTRKYRQRGCGLVGQDGDWSSLAWVWIHGAWDQVEGTSARGDPGINRLDRIAKQHDIDYSKAKNLQDRRKADAQMIASINKLPGKKTMTERIVRKIKICTPKNVWNSRVFLLSTKTELKKEGLCGFSLTANANAPFRSWDVPQGCASVAMYHI